MADFWSKNSGILYIYIYLSLLVRPCFLKAISAVGKAGGEKLKSMSEVVAKERALLIGPEEGGFGMPYKLMYGSVGFLWAALILNKYLREGIVSNDLLLPIVDAVLAGGRAGASDIPACPLMYKWHGTRH